MIAYWLEFPFVGKIGITKELAEDNVLQYNLLEEERNFIDWKFVYCVTVNPEDRKVYLHTIPEDQKHLYYG